MGFSAAGLQALHESMAGHVTSGAMPGVSYLVAGGDEAHLETIGDLSFGGWPLRKDSIFRIASLTKPVTATAAMILVEDGVLSLELPVDEWLPELAGRQVLRSIAAELEDTSPASRAITVEDLLTSRMGTGAPLAPPGTYPIQRAEADRRLQTMGPPWPPTPYDTDGWLLAFGELPLMAQPGEQWLYNTSIHVLGMLVERAAHQSLEDFLRDRVFGPLRMVDSGFSVAADRRDRLTTAYVPKDDGGLAVLDHPDGMWSEPPKQQNGAGWMVSTITDFWSFARMLQRGGAYDNGRLLSPESVEAMTTNQITDAQIASSQDFLGSAAGWGYGMATSLPGREPRAGEPRGYGWDGGTGTSWRTDPATGVTGILLTQRAMTSPAPPQVFEDFWQLTYAAMS